MTTVPAKRANGRDMSSATYWWWKNRPGAYELYCIHGASLNAICSDCERA